MNPVFPPLHLEMRGRFPLLLLERSDFPLQPSRREACHLLKLESNPRGSLPGRRGSRGFLPVRDKLHLCSQREPKDSNPKTSQDSPFSGGVNSATVTSNPEIPIDIKRLDISEATREAPGGSFITQEEPLASSQLERKITEDSRSVGDEAIFPFKRLNIAIPGSISNIRLRLCATQGIPLDTHHISRRTP